MGVGKALALGLGVTALGMSVTFVTLYGLYFVLKLMSKFIGEPNQQA